VKYTAAYNSKITFLFTEEQNKEGGGGGDGDKG
jgi:hypothetical protein